MRTWLMFWAIALLGCGLFFGYSGFMLLGEPSMETALALRQEELDPSSTLYLLRQEIQRLDAAQGTNSFDGPLRYKEQAYPKLWLALGAVFASCILLGFASLDNWAERIHNKLTGVVAQ